MLDRRLGMKVAYAFVIQFLSIANAQAETVHITASQDTSIFSDSLNSNALGGNIYTGLNNNGGARRGLVAFDVAEYVPANATVTDARLTLFLAGFSEFDETPRGTGLHRLTQPWGEGMSNAGPGPNGGRGALPTPGDATWLHNSYDGQLWDVPGASFLPDASAMIDVVIRDGGSTPVPPEDLSFTWLSTPQLVSDVQQWLTAPASNHGWLVRGDESEDGTIRRFFTREANPAYAPTLTVTFTAPLPGDANGDHRVDRNDAVILAENFGAPFGGGYGTGDFSGDGVVGLADLAVLTSHFGATANSPSDLRGVPEPTTFLIAVLGMTCAIACHRQSVRRGRRRLVAE